MKFDEYVGKTVRILLKDNLIYTGKFLEDNTSFIKIDDRYLKVINVNKNDIKIIHEVDMNAARRGRSTGVRAS